MDSEIIDLVDDDNEIQRPKKRRRRGNGQRFRQPFYLTKIPYQTHSFSTLGLEDIFYGDYKTAIILNYKCDLEFLYSRVPKLASKNTLFFLGENNPAVREELLLHADRLPHTRISFPQVGMYGVHHSKTIFLVYEGGMRVAVMTANLISVDWDEKTQGVWVQDFPRKEKENEDVEVVMKEEEDEEEVEVIKKDERNGEGGCCNDFEEYLIEYLGHLDTNPRSALQREVRRRLSSPFFYTLYYIGYPPCDSV